MGTYKGTPVRLFIADPVLLKQVYAVMGNLGFTEVSIVKVNTGYYQAMRQLYSELRQFDGLYLVNQPPRTITDSSGRQYSDHGFKDFFDGVASLFKKANRNPADQLSKCVPIFVAPQDQDIRGRYIEELFPFGIVGAFMLQVLDYHAKPDEQIEERTSELHDYLLEYFRQKDQKLTELKEHKSAADLRERRTKADQLMQRVEKLKEAKEFDKAIALCRQVIEVLPSDPEPYLESGRMLVKKKRYPPAMQMFNDASKVAEASPVPHEEIGNLRVEQTKNYIEKKRAMGREPDPKIVQGFLDDALKSYGAAIEKAKNIATLRPEQQETKRRDAVAGITENLLTLELEEVLGSEHPFIAKLGKMARDSLSEQVRGDAELPVKYLIQFGLSELHEGNFNEAERLFFKAAQYEDQALAACSRINYLGTVLRQRKRYDRAVQVYRRLIQLNPSFKGVVVFNLSVALRSQADSLRQQNPQAAADIDFQAAGSAVQALYIDPMLPKEDNFYQNTIMAGLFKQIQDLFAAGARLADRRRDPDSDPDAAKCMQARLDLENLLKQKKQREALGLLFQLAQTTQAFFLKFDEFASKPIQDFAALIEPKLRNNPKPQMRTFGKVLAVLVERGRKAPPADPDSGRTGHPQLDRVMEYMMRAEQDLAAMALAQAIFREPDLLKDARCSNHQTIMNLCSEVNSKLQNIQIDQFKPQPG